MKLLISKTAFFCLEWTSQHFLMVGEKLVKTSGLKQTGWTLSCTATKLVLTSKKEKLIQIWLITIFTWQSEFVYWVTSEWFQVLYCKKPFFTIELNFIGRRGCFFIDQFQVQLGSKFAIWTQRCSQKPVPNYMVLLEQKSFYTWDEPSVHSDGINDKLESYLDFEFCTSKEFRLHAILHEAVGAMALRIGQWLEYFHMADLGPISCLLGHVMDYSLVFCHPHPILLKQYVYISSRSWSCRSKR